MSTLPNLDATLAILAEYEAINHRCLTLTEEETEVLDDLIQRRQVLLHQMVDLDIPQMREQLLAQNDTRLEDQLTKINTMEVEVETHLESLLEVLREGLRSNQNHAKALTLYQSHNPVVHTVDDELDESNE